MGGSDDDNELHKGHRSPPWKPQLLSRVLLALVVGVVFTYGYVKLTASLETVKSDVDGYVK